MADATPTIDLGRLLRLRGMLEASAQIAATHEAAAALARAYMSLRNELLAILADHGLPDLRQECTRLFQDIPEPVIGDPHPTSRLRVASAASEAQLGLRQLQGWVQGLIDEQTLREQQRLDADARARVEHRPPTGFAG
jgi:hypothetical protein